MMVFFARLRDFLLLKIYLFGLDARISTFFQQFTAKCISYMYADFNLLVKVFTQLIFGY